MCVNKTKQNKTKQNKKGIRSFFYANKLYIMSKSQKIHIPFQGSAPRVVHLATTSGIVPGSANPSGKIPKVVVKVRAPNSTLVRRNPTKGGKYLHKKHTMRKSKKSRKQTKKKGKKYRKSSKKSRKTRK